MVRLARDPVAGVVQRLLDQAGDMTAPGRVHPVTTLLARRHQTGQAELAQVLAGGSWRGSDEVSHGPDVTLRGAEQPQQPESSRIGEQGQCGDGRVDLGRRRQRSSAIWLTISHYVRTYTHTWLV